MPFLMKREARADRKEIDQYIRRFLKVKTIGEIAERFHVKESYIKYRVFAMNLCSDREDRENSSNKRIYDDYPTYNYAQEFDKVVGFLKYAYADPDFPIEIWLNSEEIENQMLHLLKQANVPCFFCKRTDYNKKVYRRDLFVKEEK